MNRLILPLTSQFLFLTSVWIALGLALTFGLYQNCAQPGFQYEPGSQSLLSEVPPAPKFPQFNLMSANQVQASFYQIMGNIQPNNDTLIEFERRRSSFSDEGRLEAINSPYLLSSLSFAGSVCQQVWNDSNRRGQIFPAVTPDSFERYWQGVQELYLKLTKQPVPETLRPEFMNFYMRFSANQQNLLWVSTCAAILGSLANVTL